MDEGGVRDELRTLFAEACARSTTPRRWPTAAERLQALVRKAGVPHDVARARPRRLPPAGRRRAGRRPLVGDGRGHGRHLVRRHARDVHQRGRRRRGPRAARRLLGLAVRRAGARLPGQPGPHRGAGDRGGRAADGRLRAGRGACSPPTRRPATADRIVIEARLRAGRGRGRRAGRARHLRASPRTARGSLQVRVGHKAHKIVRGPTATIGASTSTDEDAGRRVLDRRRGAGARPPRRCEVEAHYGEPQDIEWAIAGGDDLPRPVPADHDARPTPAPTPRRRRRRRPAARARPGRVAGRRPPAGCASCARPSEGDAARSRARCSSRR